MGKLHEVVAVADDFRGLFDKLVVETKVTFVDRRDHFSGLMKSYESVVTDDFKRDPEIKKLVTTVGEKLDYVEEQMTKIFDSQFQREKTNCTAKADIVITAKDGKESIICKDVPVTFLLQLEKSLSALRNQVYNNIPTLDPTKDWSWDPQAGHYVNKDPAVRVTRKVPKVITKVAQDENHPGQADLISSDETCGYYNQINQSGMTTPAKKSDLLNKLDTLIHAVKTARARANETEAVKDKIAQSIFNFIGSASILKE